MPQDALTTFFGWMAVLNIAYLLFASLMLTVLRDWVSGLHARLFGLNDTDVRLTYFAWLGNYKIFTAIFSVMPYLALRLM